MANERPTDIALKAFDDAKMNYTKALGSKLDDPQVNGDWLMAHGLSYLTIGLRATYMKLEEIERALRLGRMADTTSMANQRVRDHRLNAS